MLTSIRKPNDTDEEEIDPKKAKMKDLQKLGGQMLNTSHKKVFGKIVDGTTTKTRLEEILEKTEQYTRFILL